MANKFDIIEVTPDYKHLQIREIKDDGGYHRRVLTPDMNVSAEVQEIKDTAEELWTNKVKTAWTTHLEELDARNKAEQEAKE